MIRPAASLVPDKRENMRGGHGVGWARTYLGAGEMHGIAFVTEMTLEPGADIGLHAHVDDEELYLLLDGTGTGLLDDRRFAVAPGDAWLCRAGHRHGLVNDGAEPLRFLAVLAAPATPNPATMANS